MPKNQIALTCQSIAKEYKIWRTPSSRLKAPIWSLLSRALNRHSDKNPYYTTFVALKDISFELKEGDSLGIIGRNGSGKSTLLQLLAGTLQPTQGAIKSSGRIAALLELGSGFNPEFTGRENVFIYGSILGYTKSQTLSIFDSIVDFSELKEFIDQPLKTYSSGMMIRLAFSVRIHLNPDILIIDEALAVGDFYFVQKCIRFIKNFIKDKTLILVSHDLTAVQNLCKRCLWLRDGEIAFDGSPKKAVETYLAYYQSKSEIPVSEDEETNDSGVKSTIVVQNADADVEFHDQRGNGRTHLPGNQWEVLILEGPSDGFGTGEGSIRACRLEDTKGRTLTGVVGGELVRFVIEAEASKAIDLPIFGFNLKDRLGQYIFGENTYLANRNHDLKFLPGQRAEAVFEFRMPILHPGQYAFTAALAKGTQESHEHVHWIHEALVIRSDSPITHQGLCGIPMLKISTTIE